jgi:ketosteroid isomerase-like protein
VTVTPQDGGAPIRRAGDVLSILQKQASGAWVIARDANLLTAVAN